VNGKEKKNEEGRRQVWIVWYARRNTNQLRTEEVEERGQYTPSIRKRKIERGGVKTEIRTREGDEKKKKV